MGDEVRPREQAVTTESRRTRFMFTGQLAVYEPVKHPPAVIVQQSGLPDLVSLYARRLSLQRAPRFEPTGDPWANVELVPFGRPFPVEPLHDAEVELDTVRADEAPPASVPPVPIWIGRDGVYGIWSRCHVSAELWVGIQLYDRLRDRWSFIQRFFPLRQARPAWFTSDRWRDQLDLSGLRALFDRR